VQYFFELRYDDARACFHPGVDFDTFAQPYFVVRPG
jgi:hypothetical protein